MSKKKIALALGYNGSGYSGSQINQESNTIEKRVCDEIAKLNYFNEQNAKDYSKTGLARASRTDKGVHAAMNILSIKVELDENENRTVDQLYTDLKQALRPHGIELHYILRVTNGFEPQNKCESRVYEYFVPMSAFIRETDTPETQEKRVQVFEHILSLMQGTHKYHNFTVVNPNKGISRYIKSIVTKKYTHKETEWIQVTIHGQSFMMHQIRKMMGFSILSAYQFTEKNKASEYLYQAFAPGQCHVPKAPGEMLLLSHGLFNVYNEREGPRLGSLIMTDEIQKYKENTLYPAILTEQNRELFVSWHEALEKYSDVSMSLWKGTEAEENKQKNNQAKRVSESEENKQKKVSLSEEKVE
ncbi:tRNA pseudouridine38-40 synthase [Nematocida sp. AWRm80]|nr:tRNA pseudouridine38-40 synthase [Nematocida sp. AWRm80]